MLNAIGAYVHRHNWLNENGMERHPARKRKYFHINNWKLKETRVRARTQSADEWWILSKN